MKYIRTKDGKLFNKSKIICSSFNEEYISPNWNDDIEKYLQTKIVAEADTIEELCDGFRYVSKISSYKRIYLSIEQLLKSEGIDFELCDIFGCIETDSGLIYVAKMKGVLPNGEIDWELLWNQF